MSTAADARVATCAEDGHPMYWHSPLEQVSRCACLERAELWEATDG